MPRYVALLRAINVGGRVVKMDRLRLVFEALDLRRVETFIASGNVIFDTPSADTGTLERRIEERLKRALGYEVTTFLRTTAEISACARYAPFGAPDPVEIGHSLYVLFLKAAPSKEAKSTLLALGTENDDFHAHRREVYWRRRIKSLQSISFGAQLERLLRAPATMRNVTTVRRLVLKMPAS